MLEMIIINASTFDFSQRKDVLFSKIDDETSL